MPQPPAGPAARPAVVGAGPDPDDRLRRLVLAEIVAGVVRDVERRRRRRRARTDCAGRGRRSRSPLPSWRKERIAPLRGSSPCRRRRSSRCRDRAGRRGRARSCPAGAGRTAAASRSSAARRPAATDGEPADVALRGDEQARADPRQPERRLEAAGEHARLRRAAADGDDLARFLGRVEQAVGAERERGRPLQARCVELGGEAAADASAQAPAERGSAAPRARRRARRPRRRPRGAHASQGSAASGLGGLLPPPQAAAALRRWRRLGRSSGSSPRRVGGQLRHDRLRLRIRRGLDHRRLDDGHVPWPGRLGRVGLASGGGISSRCQRARFAAAAHSERTTSAHAAAITTTIHPVERSASPAKRATRSRKAPSSASRGTREPRVEWRRHGRDPVGRGWATARPARARRRGASAQRRPLARAATRISARSSPATASSSRTRSAKAVNASSTRAGSYPSPVRGSSSVCGRSLISLTVCRAREKPAQTDLATDAGSRAPRARSPRRSGGVRPPARSPSPSSSSRTVSTASASAPSRARSARGTSRAAARRERGRASRARSAAAAHATSPRRPRGPPAPGSSSARAPIARRDPPAVQLGLGGDVEGAAGVAGRGEPVGLADVARVDDLDDERRECAGRPAAGRAARAGSAGTGRRTAAGPPPPPRVS